VRLLDACGLETQLSQKGRTAYVDANANAGLEDTLGDSGAPYVVKSPWSYIFIDRLLARRDILIDACIIPVRRLEDVAVSRVVLEMQSLYEHHFEQMDRSGGVWTEWGVVPGGITYSLDPAEQSKRLALGFHKLIETLVKADVPVLMLDFPRFATDAIYAYRKLAGVLPEFDLSEFRAIFARIANPESIRVEREAARPDSAPAPTVGLDLPSLDQLEARALRRIVRKLQEHSAALETEVERLKVSRSSFEGEPSPTSASKYEP
jgi:hypothetical protein